MRFRWYAILVGLCICSWSVSQELYYSDQLEGYLVNTIADQGERIPWVQLQEIPVYPPAKFKTKKVEKFYWRTVRDVKKVYPYVKFIGREYRRIDAMCDTIQDPQIKRKYMRQYERDLRKEYEPQMRKMTLSQGKMMIKLIDRECDATSYALIKEFRGGFVAWWWQVFAKIIGADLKDDFDTTQKEQDAIIERVITLYEAGVL